MYYDTNCSSYAVIATNTFLKYQNPIWNVTTKNFNCSTIHLYRFNFTFQEKYKSFVFLISLHLGQAQVDTQEITKYVGLTNIINTVIS